MSVESRARNVTFERDGAEIKGYLAPSSAEQPGPALVLIPDVRGLYEHFGDVARRIAAGGFTTLGLDIYSREGMPDLPDMEAVFRWMRDLPDARVLGDVEAAVGYLAARDDVRAEAVGVTGFCMGGQYALMAACKVQGIAACVSWYGMLRHPQPGPAKLASPLEMAPRLACPYLGLFGADDALIPQNDVEGLRAVLEREGKQFEIEVYPDAGHAFFNDSRPEMYRPAAAQAAWPRALAFLRRHLADR